MDDEMTTGVLGARVDELMSQLTQDLETLVRIPSIAFPDHPSEPLQQAHDVIADWLRELGMTVSTLELADTPPIVRGELPAPEGAPTVLLYSHYDIVPTGPDADWHTPAYEPTIRDGAMYGRGTADSKANVLAIIGALRALDGAPPVGVKVYIEGQEEVGGAFDTYPVEQPDAFACDAMVIADVGSVTPGTPTFTVGLRGDAVVTVSARTLASPKHSGQYGGAAPDALLALVRALATLHDEHGNVAVDGLLRNDWPSTGYTDEQFRQLAEVLDGVPLVGTGDLGSRIWSGPAITVIGIDAPSVGESVNAVSAHARAKLNLRVHPAQDAAEAQAALVRHLEAVRPFGIELTVELGDTGNGYAATTDGPAFTAATAALQDAWGDEVVTVGTGGSIPIAKALADAAPEAEVLLFGATDGFADIHAPNERVVLSEFRNATVAIASFLLRFAAAR